MYPPNILFALKPVSNVTYEQPRSGAWHAASDSTAKCQDAQQDALLKESRLLFHRHGSKVYAGRLCCQGERKVAHTR